MPNRVRSSQNFEARRPGFVVTDQAGNQHIQAFVSDGSVVSGGGGTTVVSGGPHAADHENGGSDEINVAGLSGVLADPQTAAAHAASHQNGGGDEINVAGLSGVLADPQTPADHAPTHALGGGDEVDVTDLAGFPGGTTTYLRADGTFATPPGSGGGSWIPLVTGAEPPVLVSDGAGHLILVAYP